MLKLKYELQLQTFTVAAGEIDKGYGRPKNSGLLTNLPAFAFYAYGPATDHFSNEQTMRMNTWQEDFDFG